MKITQENYKDLEELEKSLFKNVSFPGMLEQVHPNNHLEGLGLSATMPNKEQQET